MDQQQQELRRAAARAFLDSLDQLQETLKPVNGQAAPAIVQPEAKKQKLPNSGSRTPIDLSSFEQAAADIEQFMMNREQEPD